MQIRRLQPTKSHLKNNNWVKISLFFTKFSKHIYDLENNCGKKFRVLDWSGRNRHHIPEHAPEIGEMLEESL